MNRKSKFIIALAVVLLIILFSSFTTIINFVTDYMWFKKLGYTKTFLVKLLTQLKIGIPAFFILFFLITFYFKFLKKNYYKKAHIIPSKDGEKGLNKILYVVSGIISFFISSMFAGSLWFTILTFINSTNFDIKDPIFAKDLSFYIFKLPLINEAANLVLLLVFILVILTVVFYLIMFAIRRPTDDEILDFDTNIKGRGFFNNLAKNKILKTALTQIGIGGLIILIIVGINYILRSYYLVYSARGKVFGAGFTDVHVTLWVYRIMAVASIISAIGFFVGVKRKNVKLALAGPVILIAISILGNVSAGIVEKFIVEPDQISKERPYLRNNIEFTQRAYGLDNVVVKDFPINKE